MASHVNGDNATYFYSFGAEHIKKNNNKNSWTAKI